MNILALNTASTSGSIAISKNHKIAYLNYLNIRITHSERVLPQINLGLKYTNLKIGDIDLICLVNGPGSFTGLRIGLATAKGLAFGNKIPLMPFNTLKVQSANFFASKYPVLIFNDAKMKEIYTALFDENLGEILPPQSAKPKDFIQKIEKNHKKLIISGSGINKYLDLIKASKIDFIISPPTKNIVLASNIFNLITDLKIPPRYDFNFISNLEPYYLRKSQAEIMKEES